MPIVFICMQNCYLHLKFFLCFILPFAVTEKSKLHIDLRFQLILGIIIFFCYLKLAAKKMGEKVMYILRVIFEKDKVNSREDN